MMMLQQLLLFVREASVATRSVGLKHWKDLFNAHCEAETCVLSFQSWLSVLWQAASQLYPDVVAAAAAARLVSAAALMQRQVGMM